MAYYYYIGPWDYRTVGWGPCFAPPIGAIGAIDMRADASVDGNGFFAFSAPMADTTGFTAFSDGTKMDAYVMTAQERSNWQSLTGEAVADGATLLDALWDFLPLIPNTRGIIELYLQGHSLVRSRQFQGLSDPKWKKIQQVLHATYKELRKNADLGLCPADHPQKWLGAQVAKHQVDWKEIAPKDLQDKEPKRPTTTLTDDFNVADNAALSGDLTWTEVVGSWETKTNRAQITTNGGNTFCRAESDLSSTDHYAQFSLTEIGGATETNYVGPACRFASAATTCYFGGPYQNTDKATIYKAVAGTLTLLSSEVAVTISVPETWKLEANGSTIKLYQAGVERVSITDTAITTGTRCGFYGYKGGVTYPHLDDFQAEDLAAAPSGNPWYYYAQM